MADEQNTLAGSQEGDDCILHEWYSLVFLLQGDQQPRLVKG